MTRSSTLRRGFPTFRYVAAPFRWAVRTRRRRWTIAAALLAMIAAPALWWSVQLLGLPDIGEPFDVEAFRLFKIPDDRNAFVPYRRAAAMLTPPARSVATRTDYDKSLGLYWRVPAWSSAPPELRRRVEDNRDAMAIYRQAAERPDWVSVDVPASEFLTIWYARPQFHVLGLLEGSRLEEQGDMAGAWGWYRAELRTIHHLARRASFADRGMVQEWHDQLRERLSKWAADARTAPAALRRALDDVLACEAISPSDSDSLKSEYIHDLQRWIDDPMDLARQVNSRKWNSLFGATDGYLTPDQMQAIYDLWRSWRREPERRRRVIRLAVANWLACYDLPPSRRPDPDPKVTGPYDFFAHGPEAPAAARALSPEALDRWLESSPEARQKLDWWTGTRGFRMRGKWIGRIREREKANHKALVVLLASQLYRRDHASDPPAPESLVGPYLKSLPAEVGDGKEEAVPEAGTPLE